MRVWKSGLALALIALPLGAGPFLARDAQAQEPWQWHERDRWDSYNNDAGRSWAWQFERRLNRVAMRIDDARAHGDLSPREARQLSWQRDRIASRFQHAAADRYLSPRERAYLDQELAGLARRVRLDMADARGW
jgi:hypothetical protein